VIAAFTDEKSDQVTLLIDAHARVKTVSVGQAGTLSIMARAVNDPGGCSGAACKSLDGSANCCCGPGERCRSLLRTCLCEDASRPLTQGVGNWGVGGFTSGAGAWADSEGQAMPSTAEQGAPGGPSTVPPGYGRRCKRVPYWVCVGNRCWIEYAWECTYYPLPRAQFA